MKFGSIAAAAVVTTLTVSGANAANITYDILNLSNENDPTTTTYAGTGYAGVYGGTNQEVFNGIFGLEFDFSRTLMQIDIAALAGAAINSATLQFSITNGGTGTGAYDVTRYNADGTIEYSYDSPDDLGMVSGLVTPGANSIDVTGLLGGAVGDGAGWLGLHLANNGTQDAIFWSSANRLGDSDAAQVRLIVDYDVSAIPLPAGLPLLLVGMGGLALLRRRQEKA